MALSRAEQEVVINFNLDEDIASIYTAYPKMDKQARQTLQDKPGRIYLYSRQQMRGKSRVKGIHVPETANHNQDKNKSCQLWAKVRGFTGRL